MNGQQFALNSAAPRIAIWHFGAAAAFGFLPIVLFAARLRLTDALLAASIAVLFACAAILAGGLLGFLFGIPRTLQQGESMPPEAAAAGANGEPAYRVNTNLEQISDWLTKILVGVGLTQIQGIEAAGGRVAAQLSAGLGGGASADVLSSAILVYFLIFGFLAGYLWTRLFLATELRRADLGALGAIAKRASQQAEEASRQVAALQTQVQKDSAALALVIQQLTPTPGSGRVDQTEQIMQAVKDASSRMRAQIYYMAAGHRSRTWRHEKSSMELAIPIFRALAASDEADRFFLNHAQLGFALKDKAQPEWLEAELELSRAIKIRNDSGEHAWVILEFNRAICQMELDENFAADRASDATVRSRIVEDLHIASADEWIRESILPTEPTLQKFLELNRLKLSDIQH